MTFLVKQTNIAFRTFALQKSAKSAARADNPVKAANGALEEPRSIHAIAICRSSKRRLKLK